MSELVVTNITPGLDVSNAGGISLAVSQSVAIIDIKLAGTQGGLGPQGVAGVTRTYVLASAVEVMPNADLYDMVVVTGQTGPLMWNNPSPTVNLTQGQRLMLRVRDNGVAQALSFGSQYRGLAVPLPVATAVGKTMYLGFIWNGFDATWDLLAFATQL